MDKAFEVASIVGQNKPSYTESTSSVELGKTSEPGRIVNTLTFSSDCRRLGGNPRIETVPCSCPWTRWFYEPSLEGVLWIMQYHSKTLNDTKTKIITFQWNSNCYQLYCLCIEYTLVSIEIQYGRTVNVPKLSSSYT